ncbi:hypothetical protein BB560_006370, partial [Smittium megazygosporum]
KLTLNFNSDSESSDINLIDQLQNRNNSASSNSCNKEHKAFYSYNFLGLKIDSTDRIFDKITSDEILKCRVSSKIGQPIQKSIKNDNKNSTFLTLIKSRKPSQCQSKPTDHLLVQKYQTEHPKLKKSFFSSKIYGIKLNKKSATLEYDTKKSSDIQSFDNLDKFHIVNPEKNQKHNGNGDEINDIHEKLYKEVEIFSKGQSNNAQSTKLEDKPGFEFHTKISKFSKFFATNLYKKKNTKPVSEIHSKEPNNSIISPVV